MRRTAVAGHTTSSPRGHHCHISRILQDEGIGWDDHAAILLMQGYLGLSSSNCEIKLKIKGYPNLSHIHLGIHSSIAVLTHLERGASCPPDSPINLGLPLHNSKRVQQAAILSLTMCLSRMLFSSVGVQPLLGEALSGMQ